MPILPDHLSVLSAYERLWRPDTTDSDVGAAFAPGFMDYRPGARGTGVNQFRAHRREAFAALSDLSASYEPIAGSGTRFAAHATVTGVHSGGEFFGVGPSGRALRW